MEKKINNKEKIDRRKALIETGKYAAFTATAMMFLVSSAKGSGPVVSFRSVPNRLPKKR